MQHVYTHPEHLFHWGQIHWDEWITMILSAVILAALVMGLFVTGDVAVGLLSDASLAP